MYEMKLFYFRDKTNYMNCTKEYEGFIKINNNIHVISAIINEFNLTRCKNLYDGVTVEEVNIIQSMTMDEATDILQLCKIKKCNPILLKLTDEQAFELLL